MLLLVEALDLFVELKLTMDELQELRPCEEHRVAEGWWHEPATPVLRGESFTLYFLSHLLAIDLTLCIAKVFAAFSYVIHALVKLDLAHLPPPVDVVLLRPEVLDLLDLQHDGDVELIKLGHLFALEVADLLLSVLQVSIDVLLLVLHTLFLILQVADIELDALLLVVEVEAGVAKAFDFVDLSVVAELRVEVLIIVVILFFLDFFFCILFVLLAVFSLFLLDLLRSPSLLRDTLIEGKDGVVVIMVSRYQLVEVLQKLSLLILDVFDLSTLANQLLRDFLDLLDDEALGLSALLELVRESHVFGLHRFQQDELLEQEDKLELSALQVTLESVLLLLHLLDLIIKVVDFGVDLFAELLLLVSKLNHTHLLHFIVKLAHVLCAALPVGEFLLVESDFFLLMLYLSLHALLGLLVSLGLYLGLLLSLSSRLLLAALATALTLVSLFLVLFA